MVAALGDEGSEDCYSPSADQARPQLAVDDPGSQPDVLSVRRHLAGRRRRGDPDRLEQLRGRLALGDCQQSGGNGAGGGGYSSVWARPTWQPTVAGRHPRARRARPLLLADPAHGVAFYFGGRGLVVHRRDQRRLAGDRGRSWPTPIRAAPPLSGWWLADALRRGRRRQLHRCDDRQQRLHGDERRGLPRHGRVRPRHGARARRWTRISAIALQGGDGCPSVAGLSAVLGGGLGRPAPSR